VGLKAWSSFRHHGVLFAIIAIIAMSFAWKLLRAPLLCTVGLTYEAYVVWQIFHSTAWVELSQQEHDHLQQQQPQQPCSSCLAPLLFATSLATAMIFCYGCSLLWWYDVYHVCVVESPTVRTLVTAALSHSLDDVLTVLCDPTRLVTYAVGAWLLPTTLYGLPYTTAAQRSRVLRAAGFLPAVTAEGADDNEEEEEEYNDDEDENGESKILMQPGGWMKLLPKQLQTTLHDIANGGGEMCDTNLHGLSSPSLLLSSSTNKSAMNLPGRMANDSMDHASSTDDEDENDKEGCYFPYSVSPIYAPSIGVNVDDDDDEDDKDLPGTERQEMEHGEDLSLGQGGDTATMPLQSVEIELYQVVAASVRRVLLEKFAASIGREEEEQQQQRRWLAVAMACTGLFVLQQRHCATARSMLNHTVQALFMAATGSAAVGSIVLGIIMPLWLRQQREHQEQRTVHYHHPPENTTFLQNVWSLVTASSLALARATAVAVPRSPRSITDLAKMRIPWRGTIAALVLFYFRRRYLGQNRHRRRQSVAGPDGFSR
jgi:hypothetical protein